MTFKPDGDAAVKLMDIAFLFHVTIGDEVVGDFQAVENLTRKYETFTYREGGRNHAPHVLPGPASYGELVLKWGLMDREALWEWMEAVEIGEGFRRDVQIFQLNRKLKQRRAYTLQGAWPVEWKGANLDCNDAKIPIEELRLSYDYLTLEVTPDED